MRDGPRASRRGSAGEAGSVRGEPPAPADATLRATDGQRHVGVREGAKGETCRREGGLACIRAARLYIDCV